MPPRLLIERGLSLTRLGGMGPLREIAKIVRIGSGGISLPRCGPGSFIRIQAGLRLKYGNALPRLRGMLAVRKVLQIVRECAECAGTNRLHPRVLIGIAENRVRRARSLLGLIRAA